MGMTPMQAERNQPPAPEAPAPAPNYREADQIGRACLDCPNYDGAQRMCTRFSFDAKPHFTCDDFGKTEQADPATAPEAMMPPQPEQLLG